SRADTLILAICAGLVALVGCGIGLELFAGRAIAASFFVPGSAVIARPLLAFTQAAILLCLYYFLGRLLLFLPAQVSAPGAQPSRIGSATEGLGAILFIVVIAVPAAVLAALAGPVLWWLGALPWPGLSDFERTQSLGIGLGARLYLVVPVLFFSLL